MPEPADGRPEVVGLYTRPPPGTTVICADELGPVTPRTFPPAPAWSPGGHRIKGRLKYSRGTDKTWVYVGLAVVRMDLSTGNSKPRVG
ncbi:hypothetical protein [Streptosporangium roseum]|uniref:hypothetical protein n=1 Tax=Streptosporangium roseum TaxID=2001 RepID=UPI00332A7F4F